MKNAVTDRLLECVRDGRVASSYIIEGPPGAGKLDTARFFASALCCEDPSESGAPCGECRRCRLIASGKFCDVSELYSEEGKPVPVAAVRELIAETSLIPAEADFRVFVIADSEKMTAGAQNALLKSIEEPPKNTVFVLLTRDRRSLLPTVVSRSVCLVLGPMPDQELKKRLKEKFPDADGKKIDFAVAVSGGAPGVAESALEDGELISRADSVREYLAAVSRGEGPAKLGAIISPSSCTRQSLGVILPLLKLGLRDVLIYQNAPGAAKPQLLCDPDELSKIAVGISPAKAIRLFDRTERLLGLLGVNVNALAAMASLNLVACSKPGTV
ncbi:MAG: hypothetical protein IJV00_09440 [Clostridia bacterium]|nr:hypothetical protein [Clostridia bacterium]